VTELIFSEAGKVETYASVLMILGNTLPFLHEHADALYFRFIGKLRATLIGGERG